MSPDVALHPPVLRSAVQFRQCSATLKSYRFRLEKMLNRANRRALAKPVRLKASRDIRNYRPLTHNPWPKSPIRPQQLSKSHTVCRRSFTTSTQTLMEKARNAIRKAKHEHPILLPTLLIASFASLCWLALLSYDELTRELPKLGAFPPAVERHLRDAIFFTEIKPQPTVAADFFTRAIAQAEREEMDPFSAAFTGIHIRFAAALEKFGQAKGAVEVLDRLVSDLVERIEDIDLGRTTQRKPKKTGLTMVMYQHQMLSRAPSPHWKSAKTKEVGSSSK